MGFYVHPNCQVVCFALNTLGWMFSMVCMGLAKWRVWYLESSTAPSRGLAGVGMWKVCTHQPNSLHSRPIACHRYTYSDTYLPLDIRISQHLLLAASLLALLGKVLTIKGLRRVYAGQLQDDNTCNLFFTSGVLSIIGGILILIAVIWNYHSVIYEEGIHFPPSYHIPFRPDWQEIGSSVPVAVLAAFLMLLSGLFTISFQIAPDNQVYPEVLQGPHLSWWTLSCRLRLPLPSPFQLLRRTPAGRAADMLLTKDFCPAFRRPAGKPLLFKTLAVLLAYVSWAVSVGIANSLSWRVWDFKTRKGTVAVVYIGLWETSYVETLNVSGQKVGMTVFAKLNSSWGIPDEIYYGQGLILLANFLAPVALVFSTLAVWASWNRAPHPQFFRICYNTAALHLALSWFCLTLTVVWNFFADLSGRTTLQFPAEFPVTKDMILSKRITYVLPLGAMASVFSLISVILLGMDSCPKEGEKVKAEPSGPILE